MGHLLFQSFGKVRFNCNSLHPGYGIYWLSCREMIYHENSDCAHRDNDDSHWGVPNPLPPFVAEYTLTEPGGGSLEGKSWHNGFGEFFSAVEASKGSLVASQHELEGTSARYWGA